MLIKIIMGNYGLAVGKSVKLKTPQDKPFEVDTKEAERLVKLGIAKIVGAGASVLAKGEPDEDDPFGDPADDDDTARDPFDEDDDDEDSDIPEYGEENTNAELQAIAKEYGIEVPPHATKAQLIAVLDEFFNDAPTLDVKEPE